MHQRAKNVHGTLLIWESDSQDLDHVVKKYLNILNAIPISCAGQLCADQWHFNYQTDCESSEPQQFQGMYNMLSFIIL